MTADTLTLADFILARVAEDEAVAEGAGSFTPWDRTFDRDNYGCLLIQPARVLAQCKAHRAIMEECLGYDTAGGGYDDSALLAAATLRALAAIWSDHKDWREGWAA